MNNILPLISEKKEETKKRKIKKGNIETHKKLKTKREKRRKKEEITEHGIEQRKQNENKN